MELFLIKDILDLSIREKKIYCFSDYSSTDFYCGYVLSYSSDSVQIRHYDRYGQSDGIINFAYSNIRRIGIKGIYIDKMKFLIEHQQKLNELSDVSSFQLVPTSEGFLSTLQEYQNDRHFILNIDTPKESYIGFVEDIIGTTHFIFTEIDNDGYPTETGIHKIEDLSSVRINDRISRRNLLLYLWRKENSFTKSIE